MKNVMARKVVEKEEDVKHPQFVYEPYMRQPMRMPAPTLAQKFRSDWSGYQPAVSSSIAQVKEVSSSDSDSECN